MTTEMRLLCRCRSSHYGNLHIGEQLRMASLNWLDGRVIANGIVVFGFRNRSLTGE